MTPSACCAPKPRRAVHVGSVAGTAVNIVLNPLFIHGFGWGAAGSAGATVIANICTDAYFVWFTLRHSSNLSIDRGPSSTARAGVWRSRPGSREHPRHRHPLGDHEPHAERRHRHDQPVPAPLRYRRGSRDGHRAESHHDRGAGFRGIRVRRAAADRLQLRRPQYASTARHSAFFLPVPVPVRPGDDRGAQPVRPSTDGILHRGRHHHHAAPACCGFSC